MSDKVSAFLRHLDEVSKIGGQWEALCPAHDDSTPSLHVAEGDSQPVLVNCKAGCTEREILRALGIGWGAICSEDEAKARSPLSEQVDAAERELFAGRPSAEERLLEIERAKSRMTPGEYDRFFALCSMLRGYYVLRKDYELVPPEVCDCGHMLLLDSRPKAPHREALSGKRPSPRPPRRLVFDAVQHGKDRRVLQDMIDGLIDAALRRSENETSSSDGIDAYF